MPVILLALDAAAVEETSLEQISDLAPGFRVVVTRDRSEIEALLGEIEIAAGWPPLDLIVRAPRLRWFQQWAAGSDWLLRYPEAVDADLVVTNTSGIHAVPVSEHIIGMLLMCARGRQHPLRAWAQQDGFEPGEGPFQLAGKRLLLLGVGAIGERTAALASALGMEVEGIRRDPSRSARGVSKMYGPDALHERLGEADIVVMILPLSRETRGLMGVEAFRRMKTSAHFINVGRGGTVDEAALVRALAEGWIAGAALDVFEEEPLPPDSPLWKMDNVVLTAHYAGATPHYHERAMQIFIDNLERYLTGLSLHHQVDKATGY